MKSCGNVNCKWLFIICQLNYKAYNNHLLVDVKQVTGSHVIRRNRTRPTFFQHQITTRRQLSQVECWGHRFQFLLFESVLILRFMTSALRASIQRNQGLTKNNITEIWNGYKALVHSTWRDPTKQIIGCWKKLKDYSSVFAGCANYGREIYIVSVTFLWW